MTKVTEEQKNFTE